MGTSCVVCSVRFVCPVKCAIYCNWRPRCSTAAPLNSRPWRSMTRKSWKCWNHFWSNSAADTYSSIYFQYRSKRANSGAGRPAVSCTADCLSCDDCLFHMSVFNPLACRGSAASWYSGRWWVGCYMIWHSEEGMGGAAARPGPSSLYQM